MTHDVKERKATKPLELEPTNDNLSSHTTKRFINSLFQHCSQILILYLPQNPVMLQKCNTVLHQVQMQKCLKASETVKTQPRLQGDSEMLDIHSTFQCLWVKSYR